MKKKTKKEKDSDFNPFPLHRAWRPLLPSPAREGVSWGAPASPRRSSVLPPCCLGLPGLSDSSPCAAPHSPRGSRAEGVPAVRGKAGTGTLWTQTRAAQSLPVCSALPPRCTARPHSGEHLPLRSRGAQGLEPGAEQATGGGTAEFANVASGWLPGIFRYRPTPFS